MLVVVIEGTSKFKRQKTVKIHQIPERLCVNHAGNMFNAVQLLENIKAIPVTGLRGL
jgi:hypothetical protein